MKIAGILVTVQIPNATAKNKLEWESELEAFIIALEIAVESFKPSTWKVEVIG